MTYPLNTTTTIVAVQPDSPAQSAGILPGDRLISSNNQPISKTQEFIEEIMANPETPFSLVVQHEDEKQDRMLITTTSKQIQGKTVGSLGIIFEMKPLEPLSFTASLSRAASMTKDIIKNTFYAYKNIIAKTDMSQVGGPIMILSQTINGASKGMGILILLLAYISITLAVLNLIPLPILDGGQMLFYTIEAIIRRPIPFKVRYYIHVATWLAFMLLIIYLSIKDISHIVSPYVSDIMKFFTGQ